MLTPLRYATNLTQKFAINLMLLTIYVLFVICGYEALQSQWKQRFLSASASFGSGCLLPDPLRCAQHAGKSSMFLLIHFRRLTVVRGLCT